MSFACLGTIGKFSFTRGVLGTELRSPGLVASRCVILPTSLPSLDLRNGDQKLAHQASVTCNWLLSEQPEAWGHLIPGGSPSKGSVS